MTGCTPAYVISYGRREKPAASGGVMQFKMEDWTEMGMALAAGLLVAGLAFPIWVALKFTRLVRPALQK